ncbi:MAG: hypothetical protein ACI8P3_001119 [Saprospiraceae bacterium]|jgi:hypothetical protein
MYKKSGGKNQEGKIVVQIRFGTCNLRSSKVLINAIVVYLKYEYLNN